MSQDNADTPFRGYQLNSRQYFQIITALFLAGLATFALLYDVQPLLPELSREFNIGADEASLAVSVATFGIACALLLAGPLSDRFGRRPIILASLYCSALTAVLIPFAPTWPILLTLRGLQGIALAGLPAVAVAYLAEELLPKAQTRAAGIYIGGTALGGMAGRLLAGFSNEYVGWEYALLIVGILAVICAVSVHFLLPRQRGFVAGSLGIKRLWKDTRLLATDPVIVALYGVGGTLLGATVGVFNVVGYQMEELYHFTSGQISLLFLSYIIGSFTSTWAGRQASKYGLRTVLPITVFVMSVGTALLFFHSLWAIIAGLCLSVAGFFGAHGVASGWVALRGKASGGVTGQAAAGYSFFYYTGSSVFGYLIGVAWEYGWAASVGLALVLTLVAFGLSIFLKGTTSLRHRLDFD
ncbi:MAG: MFS transporter [Actinomycetaceae bacterium]|nr:MFS transporter [Actinomycetaceae bacterium]